MKFEQLNKKELVSYCQSIGIDTVKKTKKDLINSCHLHAQQEIKIAQQKGTELTLLKSKIKIIATEYSTRLGAKIAARKQEMLADNTEHYLIYNVLGITNKEGQQIDQYQNTGRFLYKYAGSFLEEVASLCLKFHNLEGGKTLIPNTLGNRPRTFEIDFLDGDDAIEIKWRDATTDGDHITKEHTRVKVIKNKGYTPIRVMFYYPQREQSKRIQATLKTIYKGLEGAYYGGNEAWTFIKDRTGFDLKAILEELAVK